MVAGGHVYLADLVPTERAESPHVNIKRRKQNCVVAYI